MQLVRDDCLFQIVACGHCPQNFRSSYEYLIYCDSEDACGH